MSKIIESAKDFNNLLRNSKINATEYLDKSKTDAMQTLDNMHNRLFKTSKEITFERAILIAKLLFLIILLILAYVNSDTSHISQRPQKFLTESITTGAMTIPPLIVFSLFRKNFNVQDLLNAAFLLFLIFFIFNVLLEFSSLNRSSFEIVGDEPPIFFDRQKVLNESIFSGWFYSMSAISIFGLILLAVQINDFDIKKHGTKHLVEFLSFSIFNSIPVLLINYNRNKKNANAQFYKACGAFGGAYLLLQGGGFFKNVIGEYE